MERRSGVWPLWVMAASGCAALGYQMVWTQQVALLLGHESAAALAVVAALFAGLSLGAAWLSGPIGRSTRPGHWYAVCEAVMATWALVLAASLPAARVALLAVLGPTPSALWQSVVGFGGTFMLLLPATVAMGATLPAMERLMDQLRAVGAPVPLLYAANTVGGVAGVLAAAFWWVPQWGLSSTALVCALLNGACALAVLLLLPKRVLPTVTLATRMLAPPGAQQPGAVGLLLTLALTGLLGIGYEVVVLRVLSQVAENTVYTLALLLAVYLAGTALGAAAWARWGGQGPRNARLHSTGLLLALCLACGVSGGVLWLAPWFKALLTLVLGGSYGAALLAEGLLATIAFGLPTVLMGALFSHLCVQAQALGLRFGTALAVNTAGAALAPVLFGAGLIVGYGVKPALLAVVAGYYVLALWSSRSRAGSYGPGGTPRPVWPTWSAATVALLVLVAAPPLMRVDLPPGGRVISYQEGALGTVSVVQDLQGGRVLRINNRQQEGSNTTAQADARQALLPLLLHPAPQRALLLGLGAGLTAQAAALDPGIDVLAVELLPEVVQAAQHFNGVLVNTSSAPNFHVQVADARRFVRSQAQTWDVIISDNFHPARAGSGALYTVEHFAAVRERLAAGGVFCQWLPLHQMDLATLRSIVRSFLAVYPQGAALLATNSLQTPVLGLWAQRTAAPLNLAATDRRLQRAAKAITLQDFGLADEWALLGSFVGGSASLSRFAAAAPLNTDDHPVISHLAPRATYEPEATPAQRLLALLDLWQVSAAELLPAAAAPEQAARLNAYFAARKHYLAAGVGVQPVADPAQMLARVREPLLAAVRLSPDFSPAYEPLLRLALAQAHREPQEAAALLQELVRLAPARRGARDALLAVSTAPSRL